MTMDRIMALLALALFTVFFGVVVFKVGRVDLAIAAAIGIGLAGYDLLTQIGPRGMRRE